MSAPLPSRCPACPRVATDEGEETHVDGVREREYGTYKLSCLHWMRFCMAELFGRVLRKG